MTPDIALALGVFFLALAITSGLAALSEGRRPYVALLLLIGAGAAGVHAWQATEGGLVLADVPMAFYRIIASLR
ncbi:MULTISPECIES: hypothetical protein [unclassified Roseivivax]|uniref:hypothetical protein n=1 Tax=Roseivivax sp. GX 12232 TaxID=2900547 RepID=UPI001E3E864C|nr:hypothetical protein [Roseivivax sp. GX 12232]MCE0506801.1 hypothetical protein [Roseivivax sp. GX 12232]